MFRREGDKFVRANQFQTLGKHVDRDLKKELKPAMENFFAWMMTMRMMMDPSWEAHRKYTGDLAEWANEVEDAGMKYHDLTHLHPKLARQIVVADEHPMKVTFAVLLLRHIKLIEWQSNWDGKVVVPSHYHIEINTEEELKKVKSRFNRQMNKLLGVFKTETC